ncbi:zinc finger protein 74-like [Mastomys coucha]|uniref:zinc finger protein 74-like n=1 Tax=Mastomys coucha TaxID=35658 RepID=UPI00126165E0|nr:zinc finger protein 74-like [Mastomys coucha]
MLENYQNLLALGPPLHRSDMISHLARGEEPWEEHRKIPRELRSEWKAEPEIMEDIYNTGLSQALILRQLKKSNQMAASPGSVLPLLL